MNKPAELKLDTVPVWINGKPVAPSGRMGDVYNPATGQVIAIRAHYTCRSDSSNETF